MKKSQDNKIQTPFQRDPVKEQWKHKVIEPMQSIAKRRPCKALKERRSTEVPSKVKQGNLGEKKPATLPKEQAYSLHKP